MDLCRAVSIVTLAEVRRLVGLGVDVNVENSGGWRPLHHVAIYGHVEVARTLVELGADVHAVTTRGDTALHLASNAKAMACLLEVGAELSRRNNVGNTPLYQAVHRGRVQP